MDSKEYAGAATHHGGEIVAWRDVDLRRFEVRAKYATRDEAPSDNGMTACSREFDGEYDHPIQTLRDLNRYHRQKFAPRSMRDHDLRHTRIETLADINRRNHAQWRQS